MARWLSTKCNSIGIGRSEIPGLNEDYSVTAAQFRSLVHAPSATRQPLHVLEMQTMATRSPKLTKSSQPPRRGPQRRDDETDQQADARHALEAVGENGAPGDPSHLMPGVQAGGYPQEVGEPNTSQDAVDDLSPEEMKRSGYPDPEETPQESQISTRQDGTAEEQMEKRIQHAHKMLDERLDSVRTQSEIAQRVRADKEDLSSFANLPNAPKGDDILILGPDEPLRASGEEDGGQLVLDKTIYRATRPFRTKRWSFVLVHPKGATLPMSQVRKAPETTGKPEESGTTETKDIKPSEETKGDENK